MKATKESPVPLAAAMISPAAPLGILLKVSAVGSCKLCLISEFALVNSICMIHISSVNATEKGSQFL